MTQDTAVFLLELLAKVNIGPVTAPHFDREVRRLQLARDELQSILEGVSDANSEDPNGERGL